ncbi:MAG: alpha/beta fold hydrolase [Pseudomonadota bacterium]
MNCRLLSIAILCATASAAGAAPIGQQGRSCHLPGSEEALRCIKVPVALDYARPDGARLALHVTVAPAFREAARPDPLFILAGGPGEAGSDVLGLLNVALRRARATRDIVFIDQRGTGLSGKLECGDKAASDSMSDAQLDAQLRACVARLGQPLAAYGTASAARDIEQVRLALGYERINLWGGSYGTRLAQAYARAFPARLRAMVLDGVAAPEQVIPAGGRDGQAALDALFDQCAANPACKRAFPELRSEFGTLAERVAGDGVKLSIIDPRSAEPVQLTMTAERFIATVHGVLYSALDSRRLPFLVHSAYQGRWEPFIARRNLSTDFGADGATSMLLHLAVVCAEDMPRLTPQLLAMDARGSFLTAGHARRMAGLCAAVNVPPVPWAAPTPIEAPVLMLSGALDPVTPPRRAQAAAASMTHAQQLVVAHAGHGISQLGCTPRLLREFLDQPGVPLKAQCLSEIPAASFQLGSAGPQP